MTLAELDTIALYGALPAAVAVVGGVAWAAKTLVYRHADTYQTGTGEAVAKPAQNTSKDLVPTR